MKKAFAMKWADALESGKYKQTTERLFNGKNGYCCLGVACVLAGKKFEFNENSGTYFPNCHDVSAYDDQILPTSIMEAIGMHDEAGTPETEDGMVKIGKREYSSLADANDHGVKFKSIAKYIRDNYKIL
jgi:hypothetical protein